MVTATEGAPPLPPLERWLGDPWGSLGELATQLVGVAAGWGLRLLLVVVPLWLAGAAVAPAAAGRWGPPDPGPAATPGGTGRG